MAVAVVIVVTLIGLLGVLLICRVASWQHTPRELRGDWWDRFERQFRAYATSRSLESDWMGPERRRRRR
jgi:hypothetical protein